MKKIKKIIVKRFPDIEFKKIILYKNPSECKQIYIERVNPTHVGIIWGRRKKKYNKGKNYIQIGKVYFGAILLSYALSVVSWLDMLTNYTYNLILTVGLYSLFVSLCVATMFYSTIFKSVGKYEATKHI